MSFGLEQPGLLLPLLAAAALALVLAARAVPARFAWPALGEARAAGARRFDGVRALGLALRGLALVALAGVLAGPVAVHTAPPEPGQGLDLVLAVDASGSMRALDAQVGGEWRTRLDLAREVVARFAAHRAAEGDRVALVVFGDAAFTQCPLTSDAELLRASLDRVEAGVAGQATALGDALVLGVRRALAGRQGPLGVDTAAGRVVVLLTDGRSNAGAVAVDDAARLASAEGIRVHTVAIGTAGAEVAMAEAGPVRGARAGSGLRFERHDVDTETLARIADATGGRFFEAHRSGDLERVYDEIDGLERVARPLPAQLHHREVPEPLLLAAGGAVLLEIAVTRVARRSLP